jgi:phosphatidylglycerol:prolipoprotein diacylglycerol transferase
VFPVLFRIPNALTVAGEYLVLEIVAAVAAFLVWLVGRLRKKEKSWVGALGSTVAILLALHVALSFFVKNDAGEPMDITIYSFGVVIILGFLAGTAFLIRQTDRLRLDAQKVFDWGFWCLVVGIIGARLLYAWLNPDQFENKKLEVFRIWNGGLVWYGGLIPAAAVGIWLLQRYKLPVLHVADAASAALMLALGIGRWACLLAGDDYGRPTDSWVGIRFYNEHALIPRAFLGTAEHAAVALHPTQLYMSLNCLWLFFVLEVIRRKSRYAGQTFAAMIVLYAVTRGVFIEPFRGDFVERNPAWGKHLAEEITIKKGEGTPAVDLARGTAVKGGTRTGKLLRDVHLDAGVASAKVWAISDEPAKADARGLAAQTLRDGPPPWDIRDVEGLPGGAQVVPAGAEWYGSHLGTPPGYVSTSQTISIVVVLAGAGLWLLVRRRKQPGFREAAADAS